MMYKFLLTIIIFFFTSHSFATNLILECNSNGGIVGTGIPLEFQKFPNIKVFLKIKNKVCEIDWQYEYSKFPLIRESDEEFVCGFDQYNNDKSGKILSMNSWNLTINRLSGKFIAFNDRHDIKNQKYRRTLEGMFRCRKANKLF